MGASLRDRALSPSATEPVPVSAPDGVTIPSAGSDGGRRQQIAAAYLAGESTVVIAARHGISRQRVEQVARWLGLPHRAPLKGKAGTRGKPEERARQKAARTAERKAEFQRVKALNEERRRHNEERRRQKPPVEPVVETVVARDLWCDQCDELVTSEQAARCPSRWCAARPARSTAQAMSARQGHDRNGHGAQPASAVLPQEGCAHD